MAAWRWRTRNWQAMCPMCGSTYSYGDVQCFNDGSNLIAYILENHDESSKLSNPQILLLKGEQNCGMAYDAILCQNDACSILIKGDYIRVEYPLLLRISNLLKFLGFSLCFIIYGITYFLLFAALLITFNPGIGILVAFGVGVFKAAPLLSKCYRTYRPLRWRVTFRKANEGATVGNALGRYT